MEGTIPTPPASSTVTSTSSLQVAPYQLLEINLISAQDLSHTAKSMKTYAIAWLHPNRKLPTLVVDTKGNANPTWNEKLKFRIDDKFLFSDTSSLTIEIYTVSWFRDVLVGTVNVLIDDLISPSHKQQRSGSRFVTLQIRRSSGDPQGILSMGYSLGKANAQNIPLYSELSGDDKKPETERTGEDAGEPDDMRLRVHEKIQLWRSRSVNELDNEDDFAMNPGSVCNGSMVNESDLCSDVGPSASVVAAELAQKSQPPDPCQRPPMTAPRVVLRANAEAGETGSSILGELTLEEAMAKGWLMDIQGKNSYGRRNRRHSDGGGLFSCFGTVCGIECHIQCGNKHGDDKKNRTRNRKGSS